MATKVVITQLGLFVLFLLLLLWTKQDSSWMRYNQVKDMEDLNNNADRKTVIRIGG